jgi:hypothetical protein
LVALLVNVIVPPVHPSAVGVKVTLTSKPCPAARTSGKLNWDMVNAALFPATAEIVTVDCPTLATVTSRVSL